MVWVAILRFGFVILLIVVLSCGDLLRLNASFVRLLKWVCWWAIVDLYFVVGSYVCCDCFGTWGLFGCYDWFGVCVVFWFCL